MKLENKLEKRPVKDIVFLDKDLPTTEAELFALEQFLLLDSDKGIRNLGTSLLFRELLELMIYHALPDDTKALKEAFMPINWHQIGKIAHKIKSGALCCGTIRLKYASQYLERYHQAGYTKHLIALYQQLMNTIQHTNEAICRWLIQSDK